ncbi:MAG: NblA/ycf18 family protein [Leptolyngbyaceae cyanobacterium MO_188.B28]|nr:NblA/ycf18 family protein [Leptolyngbyaceae cyanobacterium MO_188.B28]
MNKPPPLPASVFNLSMEQNFNLNTYKLGVSQLDKEELEQLLLDAMQQIMIKDNIIGELISPCSQESQ